MPALAPLPSPARVAANRQNAAQSTGPKTEAGKARSRQNAVSHGLTGAGIALPTEDAAALADRAEALHDQFRPATPLGVYFVDRIALAMVRTERAARHETAALAHRVRHAVAEFDRERLGAAREAIARLRLGDTDAHLDLIHSPEGITSLIDELRRLRRCLAYEKPIWSRAHGGRLEACLGIVPNSLLPSRMVALTEAVHGSNAFLTGRDRAAITEANLTPINWALRELAAVIDHEVDALSADLAAINLAPIQADRAEAADRALFDPGPSAQLARRYEAAAARDLARSLRLLHEAEAETEAKAEVMSEPPLAADPISNPEPARCEPIEDSANVVANPRSTNELAAVLGSFGSGPIGADEPREVIIPTRRTTVVCRDDGTGLE